MNKRILLPLQNGDKVVHCAKATSIGGRGNIGQVVDVIDNLTVQIKWEFAVGIDPKHSMFSTVLEISPITERAYCIRKESECHHCIHRMRHLAGQECPRSWKEVKSIHETLEPVEHVEPPGATVAGMGEEAPDQPKS